MSEYKYVQYEPVDDGRIVRIMLNRPEARNAQNRGMLVDLNDAMLRAEADDEVRRGRAAIGQLGGGRLRIVDPGLPALGGHRFVIVPKERETDARFPRRAGEPGRRPLG